MGDDRQLLIELARCLVEAMAQLKVLIITRAMWEQGMLNLLLSRAVESHVVDLARRLIMSGRILIALVNLRQETRLTATHVVGACQAFRRVRLTQRRQVVLLRLE